MSITTRHKELVMARAIWNETVIAESDRTVSVEGNHYFPPEDVNHQLLQPNSQTTTCPWKGQASYVDVVVNGEVNPAAAWFYPEPKAAAKEIAGHFAFWHGVTVEP